MDKRQAFVWIFGYGSIIWRPDFDYLERRVGYIKGWSRRFYQGSTDHRGTPTQPGRVATLLEDPNSSCWGVAFKVHRKDATKILAKLDHREKEGYDRRALPFFTEDHEIGADVLVYIAPSQNTSFLGPDSYTAMARQIASSFGFSGSNSEYLFRLADSLREMNIFDSHIFSLEQELLYQMDLHREIA